MREKRPTLQRAAIFVTAGLAAIAALRADEPVMPKVTAVYENDFNEKVDPDHWPKCEVRKGDDGNGYLAMKTWLLKFYHEDLPKHQFVRLRLRMIALGVEGTPLVEPTDYWTVSVRNGPLLLRTTFQNPGTEKRGVADGFGQSFPDEFPAGLHPARTGSVGEQVGIDENGVYEFDLVFPHGDDELVVEFQHAFTNFIGESWYVDGAKLDVISGAVPRTGAELAELWKKLVGDDAMVAHSAVGDLVASGKPGSDYVAKQWKAFSAEAAAGEKTEKQLVQEIEKHMAALESEKFAERANARMALRKLGAPAIPHLEKKLEGELTPGEKVALMKVVVALRKTLNSPMSPGHRRRLIASRVARVLRISGVTTQGLRVTGSHPAYLGALTDGYAADEVSNFNEAPKYIWFKSGGGKEGWIQYDYDQARSFSFAEAFWLDSKQNKKTGARPPESWELSYLDGEEWKPVEVEGDYPVTSGKWDRVKFAPIKTKTVRLTAKSKPDAPRMGLLEFRLGKE